MLVRITFGVRKNTVQDLPLRVAEAMIADGRGVLVFPDQYPARPVSTPKIAAAKTLSAPARKRR